MYTDEHRLEPLSWRKALLATLVAVGCFHAAYTPAQPGPWSLLILGYVAGVVQLTRLGTPRKAFYAGLLVGLACFGPQLAFFWTIFGPAAIALWTVLAFWLALFVALAHVALARLGARRAFWLVPFLWTGLEFFRSELYYLKFAWLNVGFGCLPFGPVNFMGVYGVGWCAVATMTATLWLRNLRFAGATVGFWAGCGLTTLVVGGLLLPAASRSSVLRFGPIFAGIQMEFPSVNAVVKALDEVAAEPVYKHLPVFKPQLWKNLGATNLNVIVLPEYTLDGAPPQKLKDWSRDHGKYLIVGGKEPAPGNNFYNTAYVIGTNGEVVFQQVKSVPIQFFKDGLPAPQQKVWDSPWGKIGICICYDLSYSRVTDELARQGAQMLIVPTMDVEDWGRHQHELHARVAPVRAAEYGIPIFRVASSGISQGVDRSGRVRASAPFPGEGELLFFATRLGPPASLPLDRWLAPLCVAVTGLFVGWLAVGRLRRKA